MPNLQLHSTLVVPDLLQLMAAPADADRVWGTWEENSSIGHTHSIQQGLLSY